MSLTVPPALLEAAEAGPWTTTPSSPVSATPSPYAWATVTRVVAIYSPPPVTSPTTSCRRRPRRSGPALAALASDAIRSGLERHFGVKLAFQNCHRVAAFRLSAVDTDVYRRFVSTRGSFSTQSPELRDC
ncbi:SCO5389 family protein [Micromonospora sp. WMMB482]|uniref:SCO5389 family protein n=1 Tax=Micromonospora sp. WMMB482 TaxID=2849653 RepID=UPI0035B4495C